MLGGGSVKRLTDGLRSTTESLSQSAQNALRSLSHPIKTGKSRGWLPPNGWNEDDGCSAVPDYHYRACCRAHDWMYRHGFIEIPHTAWKLYRARKSADKLLRRCMVTANRVERRNGDLTNAEFWLWYCWKPWVWWAALRLVGWRSFNRKRNGR